METRSSSSDQKSHHDLPTTTPATEHIENGGALVGFEADADDLPPGYFTSKFFVGTMMAISLGVWAATATFGYAAPILDVINEDIGPDPAYTWISLSYNVALAVCLTPLGRISDTFGRRYWFISFGVLSVVGSVVCATAKSIPVLIGGNVLLGVSASTQLSFSYTMGEIVPIKYRYMGSAFVYIFTIPGSGLGPSVAYSFLERWPSVGWRGIYWLLLAINVAALVCWVAFYFPPSFAKKHRHDNEEAGGSSGRNSKMYFVKHFDYVGTALFAAGLIVLMLGLSWGGTIYPWDSAASIASIILGFATLVAFAAWEAYGPISQPLVPIHVVKRGAWTISVIMLSIGASTYYAFAVVWPMQVASIYIDNGSYTKLGIVSSALSLSLNCGMILGGSLAGAIGKTNRQITIVFTVAAIFMAAMAANTPDNFGMAMAFVVLGNFFMGWNETVNLANTTIYVSDQRDIGIAGGLAASTRSTVSAVASAVYTTVLSNRLAQTVPSQVGPALTAAGLPESSVERFIAALESGGAAAMKSIPGVTEEIIAVGASAYKGASSDAFSTVYLVTLAFTVPAILLSLWLPDGGKYMTTKVAATLHREDVVEGGSSSPEEKTAGSLSA